MAKWILTNDDEVPVHNWVYLARITHIVDGDTFRAMVDRGFRDYQEMELRLLGIDAPETKLYKDVTPAEKRLGLYIKDMMTERLLNESVVIKSEKNPRDPWGRFLADVWHQGESIRSVVRAIMDKYPRGME